MDVLCFDVNFTLELVFCVLHVSLQIMNLPKKKSYDLISQNLTDTAWTSKMFLTSFLE